VILHSRLHLFSGSSGCLGRNQAGYTAACTAARCTDGETALSTSGNVVRGEPAAQLAKHSQQRGGLHSTLLS
jgi:hypothetical protein